MVAELAIPVRESAREEYALPTRSADDEPINEVAWSQAHPEMPGAAQIVGAHALGNYLTHPPHQPTERYGISPEGMLVGTPSRAASTPSGPELLSTRSPMTSEVNAGFLVGTPTSAPATQSDNTRSYLAHLSRIFWLAQAVLGACCLLLGFCATDAFMFFSKGVSVLHPILDMYLLGGSLALAVVAGLSIATNRRYMERTLRRL